MRSHLLKYSLLLLAWAFANAAGAQSKQAALRINDGIDEQLQINLSFYNPNGTLTQADAAVARYNNLFTKAVTSEDAGKPNNVDENVAIFRDNKWLTVERRPLVDDYDTTFLSIYHMQRRTYRLDFVPKHFLAPLLTAYIADSYTHTQTAVSLADTTKISFTVTADTGSFRLGRFTLFFRPVQKYRSIKSGNWNDRTTWQISNGILWQNADVFPSDTVETVTINPLHVVVVTENAAIAAIVEVLTGASLTIAAGKSLLIGK